MIVDDNYLSAEGIEKNIDWETLNAEIIHVCYNGTSAIEAMKKEPADLIISDIEMPDLDGISMSRQALEINPMVKIILISAYDKFEYARRALLLGALDYIEKPLDYAYLIQKVKNAFALMEKEQKNLQLLKQSRPLLTEKFFREITHLPSSEAAYRLKPYLKYLNLELNYDFYTVVILELENAPDLKAVYGIEKFQMELFNLQDLITEETASLDFVYLLPDMDGYLCILGHSGCQSNSFRLSGTEYITSSLLYNKVTGTNASALLRNFTYNQSIKRTIIFFRRRDRYEKMEKNPDISDNSLCTGHSSGRIGNSAWHSLCYRGRSQDQFFQAYHDQGAEQITEDHRSQKRAENHLEEQQSEACNGICIRQAFCHQE